MKCNLTKMALQTCFLHLFNRSPVLGSIFNSKLAYDLDKSISKQTKLEKIDILIAAKLNFTKQSIKKRKEQHEFGVKKVANTFQVDSLVMFYILTLTTFV